MGKKLEGLNPWTYIWIKPKETIHSIVASNPKHRFGVLSFLYGLPLLLHTAQNLSLGENFTTIGIITAAAVLATFAGMIALSIASGLVYWTGKWIGGKGEYYPIRAAVSWSNVPNIVTIILWGLLIYFFGDKVFFEQFNDVTLTGGRMTLVTVSLFLQTVISIWSFVILVQGIGEVQGFSSWKGVLNVLIPFFMVGIFFWALSWLFWVGNGMPGG